MADIAITIEYMLNKQHELNEINYNRRMIVLISPEDRTPVVHPFSDSAYKSMLETIERVRSILERRPRRSVPPVPVNLANISPGSRRAIFEDLGLEGETILLMEDFFASLSIFGRTRRQFGRNLLLVRLVSNLLNALRASSPASCRRIGGSGFFTATKACLRNEP